MITNDIKYVGVNDTVIDLFEGQYSVPNGISYNSYLILDEKIAVMDTVDARFANEWLSNIKSVLGDRSPDYLIVHHMEPDHSSNICAFAQEYPNATVVSSAKAFVMMKNFFNNDFPERRITVGEGDTLSLGKHQLKFFAAPMVHWPEVTVSYDIKDKVLFSADAFGKFGIPETDEPWEDEARRYYIGIVGKYGAQVQNLLKKVSTLDIEVICPLHGPVLKEGLRHCIGLYDTWSGYRPEEDGVVIAYTSVYGNTKKAVTILSEKLKENGAGTVILHDLAREDMSRAVANAFKYSTVVLATTTYNMSIFPFMREFIEHLTERNFSNRKIALIENGSWAPVAAKIMREMLCGCKNLTFAENTVKINSGVSEQNIIELETLAKELMN